MCAIGPDRMNNGLFSGTPPKTCSLLFDPGKHSSPYANGLGFPSHAHGRGNIRIVDEIRGNGKPTVHKEHKLQYWHSSARNVQVCEVWLPACARKHSSLE